MGSRRMLTPLVVLCFVLGAVGPALAVSSRGDVEVLDRGWSQYRWHEDENAVTWAIVIRNPSSSLWAAPWVMPHFFDESGQEFQLESSFEHALSLAPGETAAITETDLDVPPLSGVELELVRLDWYTRDEWVATRGAAGRFTVSDVHTIVDIAGGPVTIATVQSGFDVNVRFVEIVAVYRDLSGDVIGGNSTHDDLAVPAGGFASVTVEGVGAVPGVASVDVYVTQSGSEDGGGGGATAFRPAERLVPELTTHIPTPLDVSTDPKVVFANLLIAAVCMILFTVALRILSATLASHEGKLERAIPPVRWVTVAQRRADRLVSARLGRRADAVRLAGILLFYGVVFSLLQPGWNPLTITGLALLAYMTVAIGVAGTADDLVRWRAVRRWGLPATFAVRPGLVLLAVSSTAATRIFGIVPGIMIGTPDAFPIETDSLAERQQRTLARVGALAIVVLGAGSWVLSIATNLALRTGLPGWLRTPIAGLEAFLLLVFAVTVQSTFTQMLGLPGSIGRQIERRNRALWLAALGAITFLFLHTLLNPSGNLAESLRETNVRFFLGTVVVFVLVSVGIWLLFRRADRRAAAVAIAPPTTAFVDPPTTAPFPLPATPQPRDPAGLPPPP